MTFVAPEWAAAVRARAASAGLATARAYLGVQTDSYLSWLPETPRQQAGYYHDYFCPQHAVQLAFDAHSPGRHQCPVDGAVLSGEPYDSAWLWFVNDMLGDAALKLALRCFLARDERPSQSSLKVAWQRATAILLDYARRYEALPRAAGALPRYPGHATWSVLDESVWIIRLAWAYALLGDALAADARATICDKLLRPAAGHIQRARRRDVQNISNWNNAALATLGLALGDEALLDEANDGPAGLRVQLARGVRDDGFWYENSLSYHYYALAALVWHLRALRASGRPLDDRGVIRSMFDAPLAIALPDLTLPAIHDCWYAIGLTGAVGHGIADAAGFYETAYGWYGDPRFAWILQANYARRPRLAFEALLDGAPLIAQGESPEFASHHAVGSGLAVMRSRAPADQQIYLLLKAGAAVRGHGHPDQLSIQLFAQGERLSPDLGTPGYGVALNDGWYRQTSSHNTVLIGGASQPLGEGRIVRFEVNGNGLAEATASWEEGEYTGVCMRRVILWREEYFIDAFFVTCPALRQIDWVYHNGGEMVSRPEGCAASGELGGGAYSHVSDVCRCDQHRSVRLSWRLGRAGLDLFLSPRGRGGLLLGRGPGAPASERLSVVVRRETAREAVFVAVFAPSAAGAQPAVRRVRWQRRGRTAWRVDVETAGGWESWLVCNNRITHV